MRLLPLALLLAACADAPEPAPAATDAEADALALLEFVDGDALADAFAALDAAGYTARLALDDTPATAVAVPADAPADDDAPRIRDVVAEALSADPPYLDPAAREAYRVAVVGDTTIGGVAFRLVDATRIDPDSELGVEHVRAAVAEGGQVGALTVVRSATSALFDEDTRVEVGLAPHAGGWVPRTVRTDSWTDVPLSEPRRVRLAWTVETVGGEAL